MRRLRRQLSQLREAIRRLLGYERTPESGDSSRVYLTEHPRPPGCVIAHGCWECGAERGEPCR